MSYFWMDPAPIAVQVNAEGQPVSFEWRGSSHVVSWVAAQWREDHGWWLERTWRDTLRVTTERGLLVEVIHDLTDDTWYLQRLFD